MAEQLAQVFQENKNDAYFAGLLHDCARELSAQQLLAEAKKHKLKLTSILRKNPILLHGQISSFWAKEIFGIKKTKILKAIKNHIVGAAKMSKLEKIIFIADYIEDSRQFAAAKKLRNLIFKNKTLPKIKLLNLIVRQKALNSLTYANKKNWQIHPTLLKLIKRKV